MKLNRLAVGGVAFAAAMLASTTLFAQTNLVQNGGFEQTTLTHSWWVDQNVTGWDSRGGFNVLYFPGQGDSPTSGIFPQSLWGPDTGVNNGLTDTSPAGGNYIASDADPAYGNRQISQQINGLIVGESYTLSFYYGAAQYIQATGGTNDFWQVSLGNEVRLTPTISIPSQGFGSWRQASMKFVATSTSELLSFLAQGTPSGYPPVSLLDGVSLTLDVPDIPPVTAVPEPATFAMMGMGLAGLIAFGRRKKAVR